MGIDLKGVLNNPSIPSPAVSSDAQDKPRGMTKSAARAGNSFNLAPEHWATAYENHRKDLASKGVTPPTSWKNLHHTDQSYWISSNVGQKYGQKLIDAGLANKVIHQVSPEVTGPRDQTSNGQYINGLGDGAERSNESRLPISFDHHRELEAHANAIIDHYGTRAAGDALPKGTVKKGSGVEESHGEAIAAIGRSARAQSRGDATGAVKGFNEAVTHIRAMARFANQHGSTHGLPHAAGAMDLGTSYANEVAKAGKK
jgi:hypothetical protein